VVAGVVANREAEARGEAAESFHELPVGARELQLGSARRSGGDRDVAAAEPVCAGHALVAVRKAAQDDVDLHLEAVRVPQPDTSLTSRGMTYADMR
jgi:hypothetical protein